MFWIAGDTLWHQEDDAEYYHRVVAVGTDSTHEWSSTMSVSSENATLAIQISDNLYEGEYILLGDNDMDETMIMSPDGYECILRTWRLRSHVEDNHGCSLIWTPTIEIPYPDSVWLDVRDSFDNIICSLSVDSILGDTSWFFTLPTMQPVQTLSIRTVSSTAMVLTHAEASYDVSSGTLSLPMLDPDKI